METIFGAIFCVALVVVVIVSGRMRKNAIRKIYEEFQEKDFAYTLSFGAYDWGPGTDKIILNVGDLAQDFTDADLEPSKFLVHVKSDVWDENKNCAVIKETDLKSTAAYFCDINGKAEEKDDDGNICSTHIALEFSCHPDDIFTNPFIYDRTIELNCWKKNYDFEISHPKFEKPMTECSDWFSPEASCFREFKTKEISAASFVPENIEKKKKYPLIVWFHGAGEGGKDVNIVPLGNKLTSLVGEKIQNYFGGAFVLCPQSPTVWMQSGDTPFDILDENVKNKSSIYTESCKKLIDAFVKKNSAIDKNRIYICGASNGGYMTLNMILHYPHFFAGAVPICEPYEDSWLTDDDRKTLSQHPIWFVVAKNDDTAIPTLSVIPTTQKLKESGYDLHMNLFDSVEDSSGKYFGEDGKPYKYFDHWCWIPVLNDECSCGEEKSVWAWLAKQKL